MDAYLYGRWSTLEQTKGSTLDRQLRNTEQFADANGWTVAERIIDEGRSAYTGANITTGNLGKFAKRIVSGDIDARSAVLIVEELDRLSRQDVVTMFAWLSPLLSAGLNVAVTKSGQIINRDMMAADMGGLMMLMITAFGSHHESKKKAERVAAAWEKKRADLRAGHKVVVNHRHPQWIVIQDGEYRLHPLRARIVREAFALNLQGHGKGAIARIFNERRLTDADYDTWSLTKRKKAAWDATRIGRILHDHSAIGLWQPHSSPRGGQRKPSGKPIMLYPPVVDEGTFNRANDQRHRHQIKHQGKGRNLSNLLGPKARCASCGGKMDARGSARYRTNKDGSRTRHYFLYCQNAKVAGTCDHSRGWTYDRVEGPLLDHLLTRAMDDQHFSNDNDTAHIFEGEVFRLRRLVDDLTKGKARIVRLIRAADDDDAELEAELSASSAELKAAKEALSKAQEQLAEARGRVSPSEHIRRVNEVRALMTSENHDERYEARSRVKAALQAILESVTFDPAKRTVTVTIVGGIAVMFIRDDGAVMFFNLHKPGRPHGDVTNAAQQSAITGWARRSVGLPNVS